MSPLKISATLRNAARLRDGGWEVITYDKIDETACEMTMGWVLSTALFSPFLCGAHRVQKTVLYLTDQEIPRIMHYIRHAQASETREKDLNANLEQVAQTLWGTGSMPDQAMRALAITMVKRAMYNHSIAEPGGCMLKACASTSSTRGCCGNRLFSTIDWVGPKCNRGRADHELTRALLEGSIWDGKKVEGDGDLTSKDFKKPWTEVIDREGSLSRLASSQSQRGGKGGPSPHASPTNSSSANGKSANGGKGGQQLTPGAVATPAGKGAHVWVDVVGHAGTSLNGDGRVAAEIDRLTNIHGAAASSGVDLAADELLHLSDEILRTRRAPAQSRQYGASTGVPNVDDVLPEVPEGGHQGEALDTWINTWMNKHAISHPVERVVPVLDEDIYVGHVPEHGKHKDFFTGEVNMQRRNSMEPGRGRLQRYIYHVTAHHDVSFTYSLLSDPEPGTAAHRVDMWRRGCCPSLFHYLVAESALDADLRGIGLVESEDESDEPPELIDHMMPGLVDDSSDEEVGPVARRPRAQRMAERFGSQRAEARARRKAEMEEERDLDRRVLGAGVSVLLNDGEDDYPPDEESSGVSSDEEIEMDAAAAHATKLESEWAACTAAKVTTKPDTGPWTCFDRPPHARTLNVSQSLIDMTEEAAKRCALIVEEEKAVRKVTFAPHATTQFLNYLDEPVLEAPAAPRAFVPAVAEDEMRQAGVGKREGALREEATAAGGIAQVMSCPDWSLDAEWFAVHGGCTSRDAEILAGTRNRMFCLNGVNLIVGQDYDINMHGRELGFGQTENAWKAAKANQPRYSGCAESKRLLNIALAPEVNPFADPVTGWDSAYFVRTPTDSFKFVGVQVAPLPDVPNVYASTGSNFRAGLRERLFKKEKRFTGTTADIAKIGEFVNTAMGINNKYNIERSLFAAWRVKQWAEDFFQLRYLTSEKWAVKRVEKTINDSLAATFPEFSHKCAVKLEPMPHGKPPRIIIADGDDGQVMAMIVVKCFEDLLFKWFYKKSIKKAPKEEAVRRCVKELTKDGACLIEGDGSSWDTTNNERIRDLMENPILYHIMETLIPYGVAPPQWHEANMKACKGSEIKVFFRNTFEKIRAVISAIRRSGQRGTSCLNYWENIGNWTCSIFKEPWIFLNPAQRWGIDVTGTKRWWNGCFEGDDSLCALHPRMKKDDPLSVMFEGWWDRMGFYMEIVYVADRATFVGWHIGCKNGQPLGPGWECPDLPRAIANMGISTSPAIRAAADQGDVKTVKNLAAAKLIAYAANFAGKVKTFSRKCHYFAKELKDAVDIEDDEMSFKATGARGTSFNALEADIERKNCLQTDADEQKLLAALRCGTTWEELDAFRLREWRFDNLSDFVGYRDSLPASWRPRRTVFQSRMLG